MARSVLVPSRLLVASAMVVALAMAATACGGASLKPAKGPHGEDAFVSECKKHPEACRDKAGSVCPGGYVVLDPAAYAGVRTPAQAFRPGVVDMDAELLLFRCNGPADTRSKHVKQVCAQPALMRANADLGVHCPSE